MSSPTTPPRPPELVTERLVVRLPEPSESGSVLAFYERNRDHLAAWDPDRPAAFYTDDYWKSQLAVRRREVTEGRSAYFALHLRDDPTATIGTASLSGVTRGVMQACHLGFSIDAQHEGRGLMREGLEVVLGFAFGELQLHRVMAAYQPHNLRSAALLERLGFEREGFARDYLFLGGAWRDHVLTALVRPGE